MPCITELRMQAVKLFVCTCWDQFVVCSRSYPGHQARHSPC